MKKEYICATCGKTVERYPSTVKNDATVFCCKKCYGLYRSKILKGEGNPNYKDGSSIKLTYCKYCGKQITTGATACRDCRSTFVRQNDEVISTIKTSCSLTEAAKYLGVSRQWLSSRAKTLKIDTSHFINGRAHNLTSEEVFVIDKTISVRTVKKFFLKEVIYECNDCGLGGSWNGKPITLQLHHINGIHYDHRKDNLILLCPNCHTQRHRKR